MKTGKLLKFHRPGGDVHAYLYSDGGGYRAALYVVKTSAPDDHAPSHTVDGASEAAVERDVRAWVESRFPARPDKP